LNNIIIKSSHQLPTMLYLALLLLLTPTQGADVVNTLVSNPKASTLVSLVTKAGLADALKSSGPFTKFAPTDDAFSRVPSDTLTALAADPTGALADLLKYHVVSGAAVYAKDIKNEMQADTLAGKKIRLNTYSHNNIVDVNGKKVSQADVRADNGVIHFIDDVIMPPTKTIVQLVSEDPQLSTLLSTVKAAGIANEFLADPETLFAPTNDAFANVPSRDLTKLSGDASRLKETLEYHVVPHTLFANGLYNREFPKSADSHEDRLRVQVGSSGVKINNAKVIQTDIQATNGVIHKIDHVLIPVRVSLWLRLGGIGRR